MKLHDVQSVEVFHRSAPNRDQEWVEGKGFNSTSETVRRFSDGHWEVFDIDDQAWLPVMREGVVRVLEEERHQSKGARI